MCSSIIVEPTSKNTHSIFSARGWAVTGGFRGVGDAAPYVGGCPLTGNRANLRRGAGTPPYRYMRPLVEEGHVYIAQPPLFRITKNKRHYYAYSDNEREYLISQKEAGKEENLLLKPFYLLPFLIK